MRGVDVMRDEEGLMQYAVGGSDLPRADTQQAAVTAGLVYVTDAEPGYTRRRAGKGFAYLDETGRFLRDPFSLQRLRKLVIPPAWCEVWICRQPAGHIQATGRDARGRKQYIYHPDFRAAREATKYGGLLSFARCLPRLRARIEADMAKPGLPREKVLATVVYLLEATFIRIGNIDYAKQNRNYGITTLQNRHVKAQQNGELRFRFTGKSGRIWQLRLRDRRVTRIVKACQDLPGQQLFQYLDEAGQQQSVTSSDVNAYLREIAASVNANAGITAKDFRTWGGTLLTALLLQAFPAPQTKKEAQRNLRATIKEVGARLGNTPTICRKCYIHPRIIEAYENGWHRLHIRKTKAAELKPEEVALIALLETRKRVAR
jgi:DNA topoisomerase-1